jgi:hypothetical protein
MFAGLTDEPQVMRLLVGEVAQWCQKGPFATEKDARRWLHMMVAKGFKRHGGPTGWRYGFTYQRSQGS